jgi:hypothetical protein
MSKEIVRGPGDMGGDNNIKISFSDFFDVSRKAVEKYGAFDISLVADLPLFVDPFLLFNSKKQKYRQLHDQMIAYLRFLRDKSAQQALDAALIRAWYIFPEVKQNWLGFSVSGNRGRGLGQKFAQALHGNLGRLFKSFGDEKVTKGSHLEKLCLIREGVGRDNISDFTNNLILAFLLDYTERFAEEHIRPELCRDFAINKVHFNYETETWESATFNLPCLSEDYVLLTPRDILTKDDTWINKTDLVHDFHRIPDAIPNDQLRAEVNNYFRKILPRKPKPEEERNAIASTILQYPQLIDYFIKFKEEKGAEAESISTHKVAVSKQLYLEQFRQLPELLRLNTAFYQVSGVSYKEAYDRVEFFKDVIENKGGHRIFYMNGQPIEREADLHILYRMTWFASESDATREANDGRGPVDFKVSKGSRDKTLVEFKLASNSQLKRNLKNQAAIYEKASDAGRTIKVIVYFTEAEKKHIDEILTELKMSENQDVVLVDARNDNKPSGSKA